MKSLSDQEIETLREELASYAHVAWSHWVKTIFSRAVFHANGSATISKETVARWRPLVNTRYANLSEDMKEKDRVEADRILAIVF